MIDAEVTTFLPKNSRRYITLKLRAEEINELFYGSIAYGWKY